MIGIVLISHGNLAAGMLDSLHMFYGEELKQIDTLSLRLEDDPTKFGEKLDQKLNELDTGDGVFIVADMLGGTPCNQALMRLGDRVKVLAGMNLPLLMELLNERQFGSVNLEHLVQTAKDAVLNAGNLISETPENVIDDD